MFGREGRLPIDDVFPSVTPEKPTGETPESDTEENRENIGEFVRGWNTRMTQAYELANQNIGKSADYNKNKYDLKAKCVDLVVGDRVLVKNVRPQGTTRAGKLASYWNNVVFEVVKKLVGIPVYAVRELGTRKKARVYHRNLLKQVNELVPNTTVGNTSTTPAEENNKLPSAKLTTPRAVVPKVAGSLTNVDTPVHNEVVTPSSPDVLTPALTEVDNSPVPKLSELITPSVLKPRKKRATLNTKHKTIQKHTSPILLKSHAVDLSDSESDSDEVVVKRIPTRCLRKGPSPFLLRGRGRVPPQVLLSEGSIDESSDGEETLLEVGLSADDIESVNSDVDVVSDVERISAENSDFSDPEGQVILDIAEALATSDEIEEDNETGTESVNGDEENVSTDMSDSFHSVRSSASSDPSFLAALDESLESYNDIDISELPSRKSTRVKNPPKKLVYDELGRPEYKTASRIRKPKK